MPEAPNTDNPKYKIATIAALRAMSVELAKVIPVFGPYVSVGIGAFLTTLDKQSEKSAAGKATEISRGDILGWLRTLPKTEFDALVAEAVKKEGLPSTSQADALSIELALRAMKPGLADAVREFDQLAEMLEQDALAEGSARGLIKQELARLYGKKVPGPVFLYRNLNLGLNELKQLLALHIRAGDWVPAMNLVELSYSHLNDQAKDPDVAAADRIVSSNYEWLLKPWVLLSIFPALAAMAYIFGAIARWSYPWAGDILSMILILPALLACFYVPKLFGMTLRKTTHRVRHAIRPIAWTFIGLSTIPWSVFLYDLVRQNFL